MCARLLACPLCSQPGFHTLDSLRAGLVSVATRPLACPVCNEVLLGIDKLTIHLFGHTISHGPVGGGNESAKIVEAQAAANRNNTVWDVPGGVDNSNIRSSVNNTETNVRQRDSAIDNVSTNTGNSGTSIYIPIEEIENFRSAMKDSNATVQSGNEQVMYIFVV